ncbi:MAG TPA: cytochrome c [Candidatus Acidoferrum sp.]|nr:cytochrome c [Candidatus Acidoferrum sp.]
MTSSSLLRFALAASFLLAGCSLKQDMALQPKNRPLSPSDFFTDRRSARPLVENTVARGSLAEDEMASTKESNTFPLPVNLELLQRGQDRYQIFCTPCHGLQGDGNGMVAMRGMKHPPSYHQDRLRQVPNGYIYDVITNGFGAMLGYSAQLPPRDRWAVVAYVRALQLSRNAKVSELPPDVREKVLHPPAASQPGPGAPGGKTE